MSAAADLLLPAPVAPGHPGQHVALKTEPCVRFEDSVPVSGFWGCREESPGRCAAGVEEGGRRQCEGSRPAEQSECMWVCVCVPGVGASEWFLGAGGLGVHGSVWTCVTLNVYVCVCTVTRCASPRVCVRKSTHLCLNVCVPVTERRGGRECVCAYTRACVCVHTCMHICAGTCVRVCVWPALLEQSSVACFPAPPPSFSASVDSGRDGQSSFRISWLGRSGALEREQLCPEVDAEGPGLCGTLWCPRPPGHVPA